jgi:ABC-type Zn uptake system ZnuABC Zn-binding protein ZnuA
MKHRIARAIAGFSLVALLPVAPVAAQTPAAGEKLDVVATFSVLGDLVGRVGGDAINLDVLVGAGVDTHTYDPAPEDLVRLSQADIVFQNGLEFETWLERFYESAEPTGTLVTVTEGIDPLESGDEHHEEDGHEGDEEAHEEDGHEGDGEDHDATPHTDGDEDHEGEAGHELEHGAFDPHVWHDASNAVVMVESIRDALSEADPANAAVYEANAAAAIADLEALDAWVREQVATLPEEQRKLVTSHDTFGYFAEAYGFEVVGTALGSLSTETGDPAAGEIANLVGEIQQTGICAIFAENVSNPDLMSAVAEEAGVALAPTLFTDALGPEGSGAATYDEMMRSNVTTIVEALQGC